MKTTTKKNSGIKVNANVKSGGMHMQHARTGLRVRAGVKGGEIVLLQNHCTRLLVA